MKSTVLTRARPEVLAFGPAGDGDGAQTQGRAERCERARALRGTTCEGINKRCHRRRARKGKALLSVTVHECMSVSGTAPAKASKLVSQNTQVPKQACCLLACRPRRAEQQQINSPKVLRFGQTSSPGGGPGRRRFGSCCFGKGAKIPRMGARRSEARLSWIPGSGRVHLWLLSSCF